MQFWKEVSSYKGLRVKQDNQSNTTLTAETSIEMRHRYPGARFEPLTEAWLNLDRSMNHVAYPKYPALIKYCSPSHGINYVV